MSFSAEDCVYHNIPIEPARGLQATRVAETEAGVVLTERTDRFEIGGSWIELPVMGSFELRGGKITAWRDYFDLAQLQRQLPDAAG